MRRHGYLKPGTCGRLWEARLLLKRGLAPLAPGGRPGDVRAGVQNENLQHGYSVRNMSGECRNWCHGAGRMRLLHRPTSLCWLAPHVNPGVQGQCPVHCATSAAVRAPQIRRTLTWNDDQRTKNVCRMTARPGAEHRQNCNVLQQATPTVRLVARAAPPRPACRSQIPAGFLSSCSGLNLLDMGLAHSQLNASASLRWSGRPGSNEGKPSYCQRTIRTKLSPLVASVRLTAKTSRTAIGGPAPRRSSSGIPSHKAIAPPPDPLSVPPKGAHGQKGHLKG